MPKISHKPIIISINYTYVNFCKKTHLFNQSSFNKSKLNLYHSWMFLGKVSKIQIFYTKPRSIRNLAPHTKSDTPANQ